MRSLVYRGRLEMELVDKEIPKPGPGQVLLKVKYCGICGTDVRSYSDGLFIPPDTVMGHEIAARVAAVGSGVAGFREGDRVIVNPMPRCGSCYWCLRGEYSLCATAAEQEIGFHPGLDGGYADYLLIREPEVMLIKIPDSVGMEEAALAEPLATSLHAVKLSRFRPGDDALVVGAGMIGLGVIAFLRKAGAGKIIAVEPSAAKAALAVELGADLAIDPAGTDASPLGGKALAAVLEATDGMGSALVYECAGTPLSFGEAPRYARKGGQVILAGFCEGEARVRPLDWILREIEVKAILGYYDEFPEVLRRLEEGLLPAHKVLGAGGLISGILPLERAEAEGFRRIMAERDIVRILIDLERASS